MTTETLAEPVHLTTKQACAYLQIGKRELFGLIHGDADFPAVRIGPRTWRIPRFSLDAWMEREALRRTHRPHAPVRLLTGTGE